MHKICFQLGGLEGSQVKSITHEKSIPLTQRPGFNFCGFHVLARVWLAVTDQENDGLTHADITTIRDFCSYLLLSKSKYVQRKSSKKPKETKDGTNKV